MAGKPVDGTRSPMRVLGFTLGGALLLITFLVVVAYIRDPNHDLFWLKVAAAIWAVAPPTWFAFEWYYYDFIDSETFQQFKHSQDCMRAVWAGVGAILAGILIGH